MTTAELDPEWRRPLELAWESLRHGSFPVGAVVVDQSGSVVAEGRNRRFEDAAPPRQLAGTNLAHAEVNAIAQLPIGRYADHVVHTSLAPCLLCTSALRMVHMGEVRYAAEDWFWDGVERIPQLLSERAGRHWTARVGPAGGVAETIGEVLPALWYLDCGRPGILEDLGTPHPTIDRARQLQADGPPDDFDELVAALAS